MDAVRRSFGWISGGGGVYLWRWKQPPEVVTKRETSIIQTPPEVRYVKEGPEIVRCRECINYGFEEVDGALKLRCRWHRRDTMPEAFCSAGVKKEEDNMREILFRGKKTGTDEWVEGSLHIEYGETTKDGNRAIDYRILGMRGECDYVDPATVGQYTGLTDKNGKKIFEGDIWDCNACIGVIKWEEEVCSFEAHYVMHGIEYANAVSDYRAAKVEVIGNIHDNPELLEGVNE